MAERPCDFVTICNNCDMLTQAVSRMLFRIRSGHATKDTVFPDSA